MRDIEFRAWDEDLKKMFYSGFMVQSSGRVCMFDEAWTNALLDGGFVEDGRHKRKILEQYTGLKDKNGRKIFEGDRLRWDLPIGPHGERDQFTTTVAWRDCDASYEGINGDTKYCEVIGDIHTNPELLRTEQ